MLKTSALLLAGGGTELVRSAAEGVQTTRGVTVEFVADEAANLRMAPGISGSEHVHYDDSDTDGISITLERINLGARTQFEGLIEFTNTGRNNITELSVDASSVGDVRLTATSDLNLPLEAGETATGLGLTIDTTDIRDAEHVPSVETAVTITVDTDA